MVIYDYDYDYDNSVSQLWVCSTYPALIDSPQSRACRMAQ